MEIKDTLLTPKTTYPMKGNLNQKEPELQKKWNDENMYNEVLDKNKNKKIFYLHDGPPYANGEIHLGHALNKILKDIIIRSKGMSGYSTPFILGWDTHGLPIENALMKNKKIDTKELTTNEFRDKCREYALNQISNQKEQFFRLGLQASKEEYYLTLNKEYEKEQIKVFSKMYQEGMIFKGLKPVYWSPSSVTALAEAEIEYHDKKSPAIYVGFDMVDYEDVRAVIWTTTPWTIPANQGISVGADFDYSIIKTKKGNFLIAKDLIESFTSDLDIDTYTIDKIIKGRDLENQKIKHPLNKKEFIIMLGDHVTQDSGTGCVHTAPGHGEDDFIVGKKYNLETLCVVDKYGKMINTNKYDGIFYEDANKNIGEDLENVGALLNLKFIKHSYPHDWRTKKPVIFRATPQWFATIEQEKSGMLDAIKDTNWINSWGEKRLHNMIVDRHEWCISRQRKWGVPIPIIYKNGNPISDSSFFEHITNLFGEYGSNVWFEREAKDLLPPELIEDGADYEKETDIMDVWFDSGVSHSAVMLKKFNNYQSDLYLEGSDQYRGWFNSSLITGYITQKKAPFKSVLSHGFVLDAKGNKMSKSLGNTMLPKQIYQKYGADILRLWVSTTDYQSDVKVSDDIIKQVSDIYRRFRNSFRFILGNLADGNDFNETDIVDYKDMDELDKYIMIRLNDVNKNVQSFYDKYEFKKVIDEINIFITQDLSSFYFDYIKDVLYIHKFDSKDRRSIQTVLYNVFNTLNKLLAPILPHTTYETYNYLHDKPIYLEDFDEVQNIEDENLIEKVKKIIKFRDDVNKAIELQREKKVIGKSFEAKVSVNIKTAEYEFLKEQKNLDLYLIVSKVEFSENSGEEFEDYQIEISKYSDSYCQRCWKYFKEEELSSNILCNNCSSIIGE